MKIIILIFNWLLGAISLIFGLLLLLIAIGDVGYLFVALPWFFIALLLLPPARDYFYAKTFKRIAVKVRILLVILCLGVFLYALMDTVNMSMRNYRVQQTALTDQERIDEFNNNRKSVLSKVRENFEQNKFDMASSLTAKYLLSGDAELIKLDQQIWLERERYRNIKNITEIKAKIKTLHKNKHIELRNLYDQLWDYYPTNHEYAEKVKYLTHRINKDKKKR